MEIQETVLCMQLGKCCLNFLPFLFQREARSQSSVISLFILLMTDTVITGFLICLWFGGWLPSASTDLVFMRFLFFQNETYRSIPLLIPWICLSEEWSRSRTNWMGGTHMAETPLSAQSRLLSLTCWLIAALYSKLIISESEFDQGGWQSLFTYINMSRTFDWLLLSVGLVLGTTLFHSTTGNLDSFKYKWPEEKRSFKELLAHLFLTTGIIVSFYFLPPFFTVCSWSILTLDSLCSLLKFKVSQPINTVYNVLEDVQVHNR